MSSDLQAMMQILHCWMLPGSSPWASSVPLALGDATRLAYEILLFARKDLGASRFDLLPALWCVQKHVCS